MNFETLVDIIRNSAVAGAGGAGFPTYAKLDKRADTIILNCAECEPLLKLHRQVLEKYAYEILSALTVIADAVDAKDIIELYENGERKSITYNQVKKIGSFVEQGFIPRLKFLDVVDKVYFNEKN